MRAGLWLVVGVLGANTAAAVEIYTCVDAYGRKLTSDRPIVECLDREQLELNPSGTVRRKVGPALTAPERAAQEARERQAAEEQARIREEKRRNQALLMRYPTRAALDKDRADALVQVDEVIKSANRRVVDLQGQRVKLEAEMEFYKKDPSKAPGRLKRQLDENAQNTQAQQRFIADQEEEKKRLNTRFDLDLMRLEKLWALNNPAALSAIMAPAPTTSAAPAKPASR